MDELFEVSFTTIADMDLNSKVKPKCGKCKRYMKFIYLKYVNGIRVIFKPLFLTHDF